MKPISWTARRCPNCNALHSDQRAFIKHGHYGCACGRELQSPETGVLGDVQAQSAQALLTGIRDLHEHLRRDLTSLNLKVQEFYFIAGQIRVGLEAEFPGVQIWLSREWPWDTGRLCPSLLEGDPEDYPPGLSIHGPEQTDFDLGLNKLVFPEYDVLEGHRNGIPSISWKPCDLADRCEEIEEATGISISISDRSTPVTWPCPRCGDPVQVQPPVQTRVMDSYPSDRLARCGACSELSIIFRDGLRPAR